MYYARTGLRNTEELYALQVWERVPGFCSLHIEFERFFLKGRADTGDTWIVLESVCRSRWEASFSAEETSQGPKEVPLSTGWC